jgi:uncharacterized protein YfaS (alpha-2-macroglobulin family)
MSAPNDHVHELVDDYLHDLLGPGEVARVERHCAICPECRRSLDQARRRAEALQAVPPVEAPPQLVGATVERVADQRGRRLRLRRRALWGAGAALAASLLLLVGSHTYFAHLSASSPDLLVLGQGQLLAGTNASLRVRLVDHQSQAPLAGAPVVVSLHRKDGQSAELAQFSTDARGGGAPRFALPDWPAGSYELRVSATVGRKEEVISRTVELKRSWQLMLSSDKPVYQPGQTIRVRALGLRRPDLRPVAGEPATFTVADPKNNIVYKKQDKTSQYGIAAAECALDTELIEGAYTVACKVGDTESRLSVEVKKYVLPKFTVDVRPDRPFYAPGEPARLTVQARYTFGKPVAGAAVEVQVRASDLGERPLKTLSARTDDKGAAAVVYEVPGQLVGRPADGGDARLTFLAQVTDGAGEQQARRVGRLVTTRPLRIEAIPEGGTLVAGVANTVYVLVSQPDGAPVSKARVSVTGVEGELRTDEHGATSFTLTPRAAGASWTIRATDEQGRQAQRDDQLACGGVADDFLVRTDKAVYEAGQTMRLTALGGGSQPVFVDFLKDGQTMLTETIDLTNGQGTHSFDLPPDLFGTVRLMAYRLSGDGVAVRKTRVVQVQPPGGLRVQVTLDRKEYRPGREAVLDVRLTDAQGKPRAGGVSLAAVDEAVFAVLPQRPGLEKTFYTLEQELLQPVYALYPAWAPLDGNAAPKDRQAAERFDQALFASTANGEATGRVPARSGRQGVKRVSGAPPAPATHTLSANSFPEKVQRVELARERGLSWVKRGWVALLLALLAGGYVALWCLRPVTEVLIVHGVAACFLVPLGCIGLLLLGGLGVGTKSANTFQFVGSQVGMTARSREDMAMGAAPLPARGVDQWGEAGPGGGEEKAEAPRVREHFPETLLWEPLLIADESGRLDKPLRLTLADSITTWRLSASAVDGDGRLGAAQRPLKVFQPFFVEPTLPVSLTRGDEVAVPVAVYNYLDGPQTVRLKLSEGKWFTLLGPAEQALELRPGEVRSVRYRVKVQDVGEHELQVEARAGGVADAVRRKIEVVPDGRRVERAFNGALDRPAEVALEVPADAIDGSVKAFVKVYPSSFSQLVEGLQNIFRMPYGCFEQTSSTTYPNVLALDYLKRTGQRSPKVEATARHYIHLGYQRLLGFEVPGGGFDWYGRAPANLTLTAYGLLEFEDMARVHDVDPRLLERTRAWLLKQRAADGSWSPEGRGVHGLGAGAGERARLATTAYVGWAVFGGGKAAGQASATRQYLLKHRPEEVDDAHVLALVCNALLALDASGEAARPYLDRLEGTRKTAEGGKHAFWELGTGRRTTFYGAGLSGSIETTALAALALLQGQRHPAAARSALAWLVARKDPNGTWYSTQATVLSLKALLAGTGKPLGGDGRRHIEVRLGGHKEELLIPADQAEVMKQIDLSKHLRRGAQRLTLTETTGTAAGYQVTLRYHVPEKKGPERDEPLRIAMSYDRTSLAVGEVVKARARVENRTAAPAPMVMLDLPVPPGFAPDPGEFTALVQGGQIGRFQVMPRRVLVYLRDLAPGRPLELAYTLRAVTPVKVQGPAARAYEYYDPHKQGRSPGVRFEVTRRE